MKILILLIFTLKAITLNAQSQETYNKAKLEDNQFYNSNTEPDFSFWDVLSIRTSSKWSKWPEWVSTKQLKSTPARVEGSKLNVTFINHATFLIQTENLNILTDPIFSDRCSPVSFAGPARVHAPGIEMSKLPKIDVVIISHDHYDHLDIDTLEFLIERDNPKIYVGRRVGARIEDRKNVAELDWGESHKYNDDLTVNFVEVQHFSGRGVADRYATLWGGYVLELGDRKIFFGGDTGYADHFKKISNKYGPMDLSFIPIGAYAPRYFMKFYHMNPEESVKAHKDLKSSLSIGMHYGTFQLTQEKIDEPVKQLEVHKKKQGIADKAFITLDVGVIYEFNWDKKDYNLSGFRESH